MPSWKACSTVWLMSTKCVADPSPDMLSRLALTPLHPSSAEKALLLETCSALVLQSLMDLIDLMWVICAAGNLVTTLQLWSGLYIIHNRAIHTFS